MLIKIKLHFLVISSFVPLVFLNFDKNYLTGGDFGTATVDFKMRSKISKYVMVISSSHLLEL